MTNDEPRLRPATLHEDNVPFETALAALQQTVDALESGDLTLQETVDRFQEGTQLANYCKMKIESAELRVAELSVSNDPGDDSANAVAEDDDEVPF